jgi:hypothetical protein
MNLHPTGKGQEKHGSSGSISLPVLHQLQQKSLESDYGKDFYYNVYRRKSEMKRK